MKRALFTIQMMMGNRSLIETWRSRSLIAFIAVLLAVMPWTEHFYQFDRFLRGGQDCEFGLLALATFFCMVLVISHGFRLRIASMLAMLRWFARVFVGDECLTDWHVGGGVLALADVSPVWSPAYGRLRLPLQI